VLVYIKKEEEVKLSACASPEKSGEENKMFLHVIVLMPSLKKKTKQENKKIFMFFCFFF
jgi:hypothetical protein